MTEIDTTRFEVDPETGQIAAIFEETMRWGDWVDERMPGFEQKYAGKCLAVWDYEIVGIGDDGWEAGEQARERYPDAIPLIVYVATEREAVLLV